VVAHGDSPRRKTFTIPLLSVVVVARPPGSSTVLLGARPGCRFGPIGSTTITHITNTPGAYPTTKFIYFVFSSRGSERFSSYSLATSKQTPAPIPARLAATHTIGEWEPYSAPAASPGPITINDAPGSNNDTTFLTGGSASDATPHTT